MTCFYSLSWAHEELHPNIDVEHPCLIDSGVVTDEVIADWLPPKPLDLSRRTGVNTTYVYKSTSGLLLRQHVQRRHHPDEYRILVDSMETSSFFGSGGGLDDGGSLTNDANRRPTQLDIRNQFKSSKKK